MHFKERKNVTHLFEFNKYQSIINDSNIIYFIFDTPQLYR